MNCPSCHKEIAPDRLFCIWCDRFVQEPNAGAKAGLFRRWFAAFIDPGIALLFWVLTFGVMGAGSGASSGAGAAMTIFFVGTVLYFILYLWLLNLGLTPGKWILGERVVSKQSGGKPGIPRMLVREIVGKLISGLFLGIGYFWAIFDKDGQAWHDKIAGTVVVHSRVKAA